MISAANNPFANPELLHPALAADIAATEAWQAEHGSADVAVAVNGLAIAVEHKNQEEFAAFNTPEQYEFAKHLREQLADSLVATNQLLDTMAETPLYNGDGRDFTHYEQTEIDTWFDEQVKEWAQNGGLQWAADYISRVGGEMKIVIVPDVNLYTDDLEYIAKDFSRSQSRESDLDEDYIRLSGPHNGGEIKLMPTAPDPERKGPGYEQSTWVNKQNDENGFALQTPTSLDAVAYLYTIRQQTEGHYIDGGIPLIDGMNSNQRTYMKCIANNPHKAHLNGYVPEFYFADDMLYIEGAMVADSHEFKPILT